MITGLYSSLRRLFALCLPHLNFSRSAEELVRFSQKIVDLSACISGTLLLRLTLKHRWLLLLTVVCWTRASADIFLRYVRSCRASLARPHDDIWEPNDAGSDVASWRHAVHFRMHLCRACARHRAYRLVHEAGRLAWLALQDAVHGVVNEHAFILDCFLLGRVRKVHCFIFRR